MGQTQKLGQIIILNGTSRSGKSRIVDTSLLSPAECAEVIRQHLADDVALNTVQLSIFYTYPQDKGASRRAPTRRLTEPY